MRDVYLNTWGEIFLFRAWCEHWYGVQPSPISGGVPASFRIKCLFSLQSPFRGRPGLHSDGTCVLSSEAASPASVAPQRPRVTPRCLWEGSAFTVIMVPDAPVSTVIREHSCWLPPFQPSMVHVEGEQSLVTWHDTPIWDAL